MRPSIVLAVTIAVSLAVIAGVWYLADDACKESWLSSGFAASYNPATGCHIVFKDGKARGK
jgi:hypothetical protein